MKGDPRGKAEVQRWAIETALDQGKSVLIMGVNHECKVIPHPTRQRKFQ